MSPLLAQSGHGLVLHARQALDFAGAKFSSFSMFYNFVRRAFSAFSFSIFFGSTEDQA